MPRDRATPGSAEDWLARARSDLAIARSPLPEGAFLEDLCFHAQQAAEKALKAVRQAGIVVAWAAREISPFPRERVAVRPGEGARRQEQK
ncbi:MAG TPA: HEPN domain-containing protein [Thermoanaerobaculia bacterium]|nr:HEPN domain-containing protein [Thermoanaerobaculia bacterium]